MPDATGAQPPAGAPTTTHWGRYRVRVSDGEVAGLDPAPDDREPSPIGRSLTDGRTAAARILQPMVRTGYLRHGPRHRDNTRGDDTFTPIAWEDSLDLVADELRRVYAEHGPASVYGGSYGWASAGRFHHAQSQVHRFLNLAGGYTGSTGTYSYHAMQRTVPHVVGISAEQLMLELPSWEQVAEHAELVVAFGGLAPKNSQVSPGGVHRHRAAEGRAHCRAAGVRFVNVGPCRDDLPDADEWIAPRPHTDVALMLAVCEHIIDTGRHDLRFLTECCTGFDRFHAYLDGRQDGIRKDPAWAAEVCAIPAETIVRLAEEIAARRTLITMSWSMQRAQHGEQPCWAVIALAAVSGHLGRTGRGAGLGFGTHHSTGIAGLRHPVAALPQRADAAPRLPAIPVARIADLLLSPGAEIDFDGDRVVFPDIRLVYWCGGNPFHHHQDLNRLTAAWQVPETVVVHEPFWTASARHADIVLPTTVMLERDDFAHGRFESALSAMHRAVDPPAGVRDDYEIFTLLAERLGFADSFAEGRAAQEWVRHLYEETRIRLAAAGTTLPDFAAFWRAGEAVLADDPAALRPSGALELLRRDPVAHPLPTPSGRVELFSETVAGFGYADCPGHPAWLEPAEWLGGEGAARHPLQLVSNQPATRLHSQLDHGVVSRESKVAGREPVSLHPDDARRRGIAEGDVVRVFNDRGACLAGARVTPEVMSGVVVMATGAWYDPVAPGGLDRHGNPNVLTADRRTSALAQGPASGTTLVEVEAWSGPAPEVRSFQPPELADAGWLSRTSPRRAAGDVRERCAGAGPDRGPRS
ncbi:molybdopterin-dependent oxidoreductase [Nocardioides humi]|uniref:Molybdopterin guanine dinucleotide-containing S/N-oxide reductase n=1 Tax=Nocardioides humi TaxID=449461 RepID=A0ABN2BDP5_9ACTN|nr:molybdopterin-dependent oxidoreductase [Nocardioides humi]